MSYKQIRYVTDFTEEKLAKDAMKTAEAYDAPGIGKWRIEKVDGRIHYIFIPALPLCIILDRDKSGFYWAKLGRDTAEMFKEKLPGHEVFYMLEPPLVEKK